MEGSILNIAPVKRRGIRLLMSFYGLSETGKTLSALKVAAGIEPNPAKRMLLDTEGGQRGRAYVDLIEGGYLYAALTPPFSPERYIQALGEIESHGVTVLVIDSVSHAWFAEGGILDMVENAGEKNDMAKWAKPKRRLGKMTQRILRSDMHIILCSRAKQPLIEDVVDGRKKLVPGPVVPVQEKTLRYDMTIMAQMLGDGRFTVRAPEGKCPGSLRPIFAGQDVMNEEMGRRLAAWADSDGGKSPEARALEIRMEEIATDGTEALRAEWKKLSAEQRAMLQGSAGNLGSIAKAADEEKRRAAEDAAHREANAEAAQDLANPFGPPAEPEAELGTAEAEAFAASIVAGCDAAPTKVAFEDRRAHAVDALADLPEAARASALAQISGIAARKWGL